jgi:hypothetical protein
VVKPILVIASGAKQSRAVYAALDWLAFGLLRDRSARNDEGV